MTPDRRLDQVEPALSEGLQKIDRLVDGQGKLVDLATSTDRKADTTAKGVANLTLKVDQLTGNQASLTAKVDQLTDGQTNLTAKVGQLADNQTSLTAKVDQLTDNQASLTIKVGQLSDDQASLRQEMQRNIAQVDGKVDNLRTEMNQRFDELITLIRERLS